MSGSESFDHLPRINLEEALERSMNSPEFLQELADAFVSDNLPKYLPQLQEAARQRDFEQITSNAHGLKGGCGAISLTRCREMAYALEMAGRNRDEETVDRVLPLLEEEAEQIKKMISNQELIHHK